MRCIAEVAPLTVRRRSRWSTDEKRCQREAVTRGLCQQHANMRECAYSACADHARVQQNSLWFCRRHARLYKDHDRIVDRILSIPPR